LAGAALLDVAVASAPVGRGETPAADRKRAPHGAGNVHYSLESYQWIDRRAVAAFDRQRRECDYELILVQPPRGRGQLLEVKAFDDVDRAAKLAAMPRG